jgi:DNA-binding Lrp family transcriptional regulator
VSIAVLTRVLAESEATLATRLVAIVLADAAHDDGVTWAPQKLIAKKAKLSTEAVRQATKRLQQSGEIEIRQVQRGRKRINVYRLAYGLISVDYDRLPFELTEPFTTTPSKLVSSFVTAPSSPASRPQENQGSPTDIPVRENRKTPRGTTSPCPPQQLDDVTRVYGYWRLKRGKTSKRYDEISPQRRKKIETRLREFTVDELFKALDGVCVDEDRWPDRSKYDDLTIVFRSREQVDRFIEIADRPEPGRERGLSPEEIRRRYGSGAA